MSTLIVSMIISIIYFVISQNEKLRFLSKSVAELGLNKDVPCLLSDPFHRTTLPFPLDITI